MASDALYEDRQLRITPSSIEGPRGVYDLDEVVGLEPRIPLVELLVEFAVVAVALIALPSLSGWASALAIGMGTLTLMLFGFTCFNLRRLFVRTSAGLMPLGGLVDSSDRRKLLSAFVRAKKGR